MSDYYDTIADGYDELYKEEQLDKARKTISFLEENNIKPKGMILDVGAGTGVSSELLRDKGCRCILLEPSRKMLEHCQLGGVIKSVGSGDSIPFPDDFFDGVISLTSLHHCDIKKAIKEAERVVKKGGWIAISLLQKNAKEHKELFKEYKSKDIGKDLLFIRF